MPRVTPSSPTLSKTPMGITGFDEIAWDVVPTGRSALTFVAAGYGRPPAMMKHAVSNGHLSVYASDLDDMLGGTGLYHCLTPSLEDFPQHLVRGGRSSGFNPQPHLASGLLDS